MTALLKPRALPRLNLGLEFIEFQNDTTGVELEKLFGAVMAKIRTGEYDNDDKLPDTSEMQEIVALTKKRFGLRIDFQCNWHEAAVMPFFPNVHHVFMKEWLQGHSIDRSQQKILARSDVQKGTVDTEKVYVTGIFSEYEVPIFLHLSDLTRQDYSVAEIVAIFYHELGHAFYSCEYSDRLERTNQVFQDVFRELSGNKDKKNVTYVYRELKKVNPEILESEVDQLFGENKVVAGYTWYKVCIGPVKAQFTNKAYDRTAFEAAADGFVNRMGYGRALVTGLTKLHGHEFLGSNTPGQVVFSFLLSTLRFMLGVVSMGVALYGGFFFTFYFTSIAFFALLRGSGDDLRDMTYDELKVRYQRVRNDMIEFIKRGKLKNEKSAEIIADIKFMDDLIQNTAKEKNFFTMLANVIFPSARDANKSINEQQLMEKLLFNDLFLKSAELKTAV